jgi:DNA-binding transcriptional ArsR family regulator
MDPDGRPSRRETPPRRILNRMVNSQTLNRTFSALSDPTRRAMLEQLSLGPATVSELAAPARISLPGALKHVRILEEADLVASEKRGRTRECRLGPAQLEDATAWIERYRSRWDRRPDRLEAVIDKRKGGSR